MKNSLKVRAVSLLLTATVFLFGSTVSPAQVIGSGGGSDDPGDVPPGCTQPDCIYDVFNISTGYNHNTASYQSQLSVDPSWKLVAVPTNSLVAAGGPVWIIWPLTPTWGVFPNAKWVSFSQSSAYAPNNWASWNIGSFRFENCFCVCEPTTVHIKFDLMADDQVKAYLDNILLVDGTGSSSTAHFTLSSKLSVDTVLTLSPGTHCLNVDLYNVGGSAIGFSLEGAITGPHILRSVCCKPLGRICGTKWHDENCDGHIDEQYFMDASMQGWTVVLKDNLGNIIATQVTDALGNYCFDDLPAGTYTVSEVNQSGWTQSFPATSTHTINLLAGDAAKASFGNCQHVDPPCYFNVNFEAPIVNCKVDFNSFISSVPAGYQVVATHWTFGDGNSSDLPDPTHYYTSTGTYTVCLSVTIFNGVECCTKTYCRDITITHTCTGGCDIEADIKTTFNSANCSYTFSPNVSVANAPILTYQWDFGDGTSSNQQTVIHQFNAPGIYLVCLTVFASDQGNCCFKKICVEVEVPECGPGTRSGKVEPIPVNLTDKNVLVLDQNVPNPFAEQTTISYLLPDDVKRAQILFYNADGKLINQVELTQRGKGQLNVFANDLSNGFYTYTLVVDGKIIDTKRMIKNK